MATKKQTFRQWFERLTWGQRLGFAAGVLAVVLGRDHIPTDPDTWKEWIATGTAALTLAAAVGSLLHGKDAKGGES